MNQHSCNVSTVYCDWNHVCFGWTVPFKLPGKSEFLKLSQTKDRWTHEQTLMEPPDFK